MAGRSDRDRHSRTQRTSATILGQRSGGSRSDFEQAATAYSRTNIIRRDGTNIPGAFELMFPNSILPTDYLLIAPDLVDCNRGQPTGDKDCDDEITQASKVIVERFYQVPDWPFQ
jgi:hypothetical protein